MAESHRIVVGVDGSEGAIAAVRWAVAEAALRGAEVHLVHGWEVPYVAAFGHEPFLDRDLLAGNAAALVEAVVDEAREMAPGVTVTGSAVYGSPGAALIEAARSADLAVVGSRGHGGFAGLLLGSVSQQLVHHPPCPVVVVPHSA